MSNIWVIADNPERAYELLTKAAELAGQTGGKVSCYLAGNQAAGEAAISMGADSAVLIPVPDAGLWEGYAPALADAAKAEAPKAILVSATRRGKDLAAQMAAIIEAPLVSDCKNLEFEGDKAVCERMLYGGLAVETLESEAAIIMASFAPRSFEAPSADSGRSGEVKSLDSAPIDGIEVTGRTPKQTEGVELGDADLVVGVGRGFESQDDLAIAQEVADALGAEMACSRPIAEFFKWLPEDRYLGISGQTIRSSLYLAAGISGQVQHLYGIRDVKTIVAVNTDQNAPIFKVADYFVVGDVKEFLPAFKQAVLDAKG
jgi:electron transfer flavoprotein alpha subunit